MFVPLFSKGSEGILAAAFSQKFERFAGEAQAAEPWGSGKLGVRSYARACLSFPFWEVPQSQHWCFKLDCGFLHLPEREAGLEALPCFLALYGPQLRGNKRGHHPLINSSPGKVWGARAVVMIQLLQVCPKCFGS